jgi:hypothetical protein
MDRRAEAAYAGDGKNGGPQEGRPRRTLFIDQDGTSVKVAGGQNEPLAFHVVEEEGWQ